jgi:hypothetical protein
MKCPFRTNTNNVVGMDYGVRCTSGKGETSKEYACEVKICVLVINL